MEGTKTGVAENKFLSASEVVIRTDKLTKRFGDFIATNEITFEFMPERSSVFWELMEREKQRP